MTILTRDKVPDTPLEMIGQTIAHYRIIVKLGEGGMGVVYRATDTKLQRDVALKLLPDELTADLSRRTRFQREAQLLAALNHPNIAAVYGIEDNAIVMELVEGPTLADRIAAGPIPPDEALAIARQIADALEAAHDKGIIHRDLKPANIKLTPDGQVKVLDFGLAKALDEAPAQDRNPANSPTLVAGRSLPGLILGTASYMSPEQARGGHVDKRTDIWAFGVVLYEMLTAKRLFEGETISDTLAQVLTKEPDFTAIPANLRPVLDRCLQRDRKQRLRDIGDVWLVQTEQPRLSSGRTSSYLPWAAAGLLAGVLATIAAVFLFRSTAPQSPVRRYTITTPEFDTHVLVRPLAISPDGKRIAYVAAGRLWIRRLDQEEARQVEDSEDAIGPFWSPDSAACGFAARNLLKVAQVAGGKPTTLTAVTSFRGGAWSPDGQTIAYASRDVGLSFIPARGGAPKLLPTTLSQVSSGYFYNPSYLPSPKPFLVVETSSTTPNSIAMINAETGEGRILTKGFFPAVSSSGRILYQASRSSPALWALPLSFRTLRPTADPFQLPIEGMGPSVSATGTLVYGSSGVRRNQLSLRDRSGKLLQHVGRPLLAINLIRVSPDGSKVAVTAEESGNRDLWVLDLDGSRNQRLTFDPTEEGAPVWHPSGHALAFRSAKDGRNSDVYFQALDPPGKPVLVLSSPLSDLPGDWTPDGNTLVCFQAKREGSLFGFDLLRLDRHPDGSFGKAIPLFPSPFSETYPRLSPDGKWVAYASDASGRSEVYVRRFPSGEGQWQVSYDEGSFPVWAKDGKELFYARTDGMLMAAAVKPGSSFASETPREVFRLPRSRLPESRIFSFDALPDGNRFVVTDFEWLSGREPDSIYDSIHVYDNWEHDLPNNRQESNP